MGHEAIGLLERAFVEQELDALTGRHLAFFVLTLAAFFAATFFRELVTAL